MSKSKKFRRPHKTLSVKEIQEFELFREAEEQAMALTCPNCGDQMTEGTDVIGGVEVKAYRCNGCEYTQTAD